MKVDVDLEKTYKELFELREENKMYSGLIATYKTHIYELTQDKKYVTKKYMRKQLNELLEMY